jgi:photosystem II stability/assembly factor-like uncharacterized protein
MYRAALFLALSSPALALAADERTCTMRDAALPANNQTVVLCEQGLVLVTTDDGATWATRRIAQAGGFRAIEFGDASHGLAIADGGQIYATDDAGRTWQKRNSGTEENLTDIQMIGNDGWVAGYTGTILHTADGGKTWSKQDSGSKLTLEALYFSDAQNGWAVGWSGTVVRTTDGGKSWKAVKNTGASWSLSAVYFRDANLGFISGFAGQLFRTKDGGATWEAKKVPVSGWLTSVSSGAGNRLWITTDDGFLTSDDNGDTWKPQPAESKLFVFRLLRNSGSIWALGPFGILKQEADGKFKRISNPLSGDAEAK